MKNHSSCSFDYINGFFEQAVGVNAMITSTAAPVVDRVATAVSLVGMVRFYKSRVQNNQFKYLCFYECNVLLIELYG